MDILTELLHNLTVDRLPPPERLMNRHTNGMSLLFHGEVSACSFSCIHVYMTT